MQRKESREATSFPIRKDWVPEYVDGLQVGGGSLEFNPDTSGSVINFNLVLHPHLTPAFERYLADVPVFEWDKEEAGRRAFLVGHQPTIAVSPMGIIVRNLYTQRGPYHHQNERELYETPLDRGGLSHAPTLMYARRTLENFVTFTDNESFQEKAYDLWFEFIRPTDYEEMQARIQRLLHRGVISEGPYRKLLYSQINLHART